MDPYSASGSGLGAPTADLVVLDGFRMFHSLFFDSRFASHLVADQIDIADDDAQFIKGVSNKTLINGSR